MKLKKNYKIREIAGEKILIVQEPESVDLSKVVVLNATSEWLWNELFEKDFTEDDVVDLLHRRFDAPAEKIRKDAQYWISALQNANLLAE